MTNHTIITPEELKIMCDQFFQDHPELIPNAEMGTKIESLTCEEFTDFSSKWFSEYHKFHSPIIRNAVSILRGTFEFDETYSNSEEDPLKLPGNTKILKQLNTVINEYADSLMNMPAYRVKQTELVTYMEQKRVETARQVTVNDEQFRAIDLCDVLWAGWECDAIAWVVDHNGVNKLVTTNHGQPMFSDRSFLEERIKEYQKAIEDSQRLLNLLTK